MVDGHDVPLTKRSDDDLGRWGVARAIHRVVHSAPSGWSTRIGLYGKWGAGKTSVLNFLHAIETEHKSLVVTVSAWSAVAESGVVELLYSELSAELKRNEVRLPRFLTLRRWISFVPGLKWLQGLSPVAAAALNMVSPGSGELASKAGGLIASKLRFTRADVDALMGAVKTGGFERVVIFIDDLDRADPRLVPATLLALRELLDWPGLAFVLAFDKDVVASALVQHSPAFGASADRFLEKIVDVPFSLPEPTPLQSQALAMRVLAACAPFLQRDAVDELSKFLPANPRTAKLVARSIGAMSAVASRHDHGELDWVLMGLHQALRAVAPRIAVELERELTNDISSRTPDVVRAAFKDEDYLEELWKVVSESTRSVASEVDLAYARRLVERIARGRRYVPWPKTAYELRLGFDEPAFTFREYKALLGAATEGAFASVLARGLEDGAARGAVSVEEAAVELGKVAVLGYDLALDAASSSRTESAHRENCALASRRLAFLKELLNLGSASPAGRVARSATHCGALFGVYARWFHFDVIEEDRQLRDEERRLLIASFGQCAEPRRLYADLAPWDWDKGVFALPGVDPQRFARFRAEIVQELAGSAVRSIVQSFLVEDGVAGLDRADDAPLGAWMLESPQSPIYADQMAASSLTELMLGSARNSDHIARSVVCENAYTYLVWLIEGRRGGSWATDEDRAGLARQQVHLVSAAWEAVVGIPFQFRMLSGIRRLRASIIAAGFPEEAFPEPGWLRRSG